MTDPLKESGLFRFVIGLLTMATAIGGFAALFFIAIPRGNENAIMFALGAVFGWAGAVVASEYGATTTGRKVAEQAVRTMERQSLAEPQQVQVVNPPNDPVPVQPGEPQ
jgi:hypothetical protein